MASTSITNHSEVTINIPAEIGGGTLASGVTAVVPYDFSTVAAAMVDADLIDDVTLKTVPIVENQVIDFDTVSAILGSEAGSNAGFTFKADGAGSGYMGADTQLIPNIYTVGGSGDVDYTTIKEAVVAAITAGASASNPYLIRIYPGTYHEDPITIINGITVTSDNGESGSVQVIANNANTDLFTMTGGYLIGVEPSGVLDPVRALIHVTSGRAVVNNIALRQCSNGIMVTGAARVIGDGIRSFITAAGQDIDTAIWVDGYGSVAVIHGIVLSVTPAAAALYSKNAIKTCVKATNQSQIQMVGVSLSCTYYDSTQSLIYADTGARILGQSIVTQNGYIGTHIGAGGSNTTIITQGGYEHGNFLNVKIDSATGFYTGVPVFVDRSAVSIVPGGNSSGLLMQEDTKEVSLVLPASLLYPGGRTADFGTWLLDNRPSGVTTGGAVTAGSGLSVDVTAGTGWINDGTSAANISWDAATLGLSADSTTYVFIDKITLLPTVSLSTPATTQALLAIVVTDSSVVRFVHANEKMASLVVGKIQDYLFKTRRFAKNEGLSTEVGSGSTKFTVASGSYYLGLQIIPFDGYTDAAFSYFYGTDGATEVAAQTTLNNTQYDNAGTLTTMTDAHYRADSLYLTSDGRISVVYGTAEEASQADAEDLAAFTAAPSFMESSAFPLAQLVVLKGSGIVSIIDRRTTTSASAGGGTITDHGQLSGLDDDDHPQYLLDTGARPMNGDLDLGGNNIVSANLIDGVDITAHAIRHQPGGIDEIATDVPVNVLVGATEDAGSAPSLARSDHQHGILAGEFATTVDVENDGGSASSVSRADHVHGLPTTGVVPGIYRLAGGDSLTFDAYGRATDAVAVVRRVDTVAGRLIGGGDIGDGDLTIDLATSGVVAGNYGNAAQVSTFTVDAYGRLTTVGFSAIQVAESQVTSLTTDLGNRALTSTAINTTARLTGGGNLSTSRTLDLAATGSAGSYSYVTFDTYGRETSGLLNSILTTARLTGGGDLSATRTLDLAVSGVSAAAYTYGNGSITFDAYGRATTASSASNLVLTTRAVNTTAGQLTGGGALSADLALGLATSGVAANSYIISSVTVDAYGRVTSATSGTTGTPVATDNANSAGSGTALALANHVHQTKADVTNVTGTSIITTTSTTDVVLTGQTLTPGAGNWLATFSCNTSNTNGNTNTNFSIYVNGVQVAVTERQVRIVGNAIAQFVSITTLLTGVTGGQAVDVRWRVSANTGTVTNRELVLVRAV